MVRIFFMFLAGIFLWTGQVMAQSLDQKATLDKERVEIQKQLRMIEQAYKATHNVSRAAMIELSTLNRKIDGQERFIISMAKQSLISAEELTATTLEISAIKKSVETLQDHYYHPVQKETPKPAPEPEPTPSTPSSYVPPVVVHRDYPSLNTDNSVFNIPANSDFAQYRGRLAYPTDVGILSQGFGRYKLEGYGPNILGDNPGCTFSAPVNAPVKAIFEGEVIGASKLGTLFYVILKHGKYSTAYSNLASTTLTKGMRVKAGQVIGTVGMDEETGYGKLDFILMVDDKNVDPKDWFSPIK